MKLQEMYEAQLELDRKILEEHPLVFGENRLESKVLALLVELGEVANEWRGFKFWSHDRESRTTVRCIRCSGTGEKYDYTFIDKQECDWCLGNGSLSNPLLEEYADCVHFILSIGNDLGVIIPKFNTERDSYDHTKYETIELFIHTSKCVNAILNGGGDANRYRKAFRAIVMLGYKLGFEWEEVEEYYFKKNEINHERQENNY